MTRSLIKSMSKSGSSEFNGPADRFKFIYFLIFFLGLSGHLPWNAILTAQPYFKARLAGSTLATEFTAHFAIIFKALKLIVFSLVSVAGIKINDKLWIGGAAMGNVLIFAIFSGMVVQEGTGMSPNSFYLASLSLVIAAGTFLALFECGMYSILGTFPGHLTQSFMAGNAIGGILAALNLIISFYTAHSDIYSSTRIYFIISTLVFLLSVLCFIVFICTDYFKFYQKRLALYTVVSQVKPEDSALEGSRANSYDELQKSKELLVQRPNFLEVSSLDLIKRLWSPNSALFAIGFGNLTIFPALVSVTESTESAIKGNSAFDHELFVPLAFLVVSTGDFIGKLLLSFDFIRKFDNLPFTSMSLARLTIVPLLLLGNIKIGGKSLIFPPLLASNTIFFILLTLAFVSGSYIATIITMSVPKKLDVTEQSRATVLLCSAGLLGVFCGSVFSLCLKLMLRSLTTK